MLLPYLNPAIRLEDNSNQQIFVVINLISSIYTSVNWHQNIDNIYKSLPNVVFFKGYQKDIIGNFFFNNKNFNSLFIDTNYLDDTDRNKIFFEMVENISSYQNLNESQSSLFDYLFHRFGKHSIDIIFEKISQKFWKQSTTNISSIALNIVHMYRLIFFNEGISSSLKEYKFFNDVVGYPVQDNIPINFIADKTPSIYPEKYGLYNLIDELKKKLNKLNVDIKLNCKINEINFNDRKIKNFIVNGQHFKEFDEILWTGPNKLHGLLNLKNTRVFDPSIRHRTTYVLLNKPLATSGIYWAWDYDDDNQIIRVSFPNNYCKTLNKSNLNVVILEHHVFDHNDDWNETILNYLIKKKICIKEDVIKILSSDDCVRSFFVPTLNNINLDIEMISSIDNLNIKNLHLGSSKISQKIFYLHDLLADAYKRLKSKRIL